MVNHEESRLAVVSPPSKEELSELDISGRLAKARRHRDDLKLQRACGDRRRKRKLLEPVRNAEDKVKLLEEFKLNFERARKNIAILGTCPACNAATDFQPRENDCFAAYCRSESCASRWELRHDPKTSSRIPVFFRIAQALTYGQLICLLSGLMMSLAAMYLPFRLLGTSFFHRERSSLEALLIVVRGSGIDELR